MLNDWACSKTIAVPVLRCAAYGLLFLDFDLEPNIDITRRVASLNTPIFGGTFPEQYFYLIVGDTKRFQISNHSFIEIALCIQRATSETVDADMGKVFWLFGIWSAHEPMGQMSYRNNLSGQIRGDRRRWLYGETAISRNGSHVSVLRESYGRCRSASDRGMTW